MLLLFGTLFADKSFLSNTKNYLISVSAFNDNAVKKSFKFDNKSLYQIFMCIDLDLEVLVNNNNLFNKVKEEQDIFIIIISKHRA
jgi:hypothetical protein